MCTCGREIESIRADGLYKSERVITSAQGARVTVGDGADLQVSLLSEAVSGFSAGAALETSAAGTAAGVPLTGLVTWLILAALLLFGIEWYLYQRGLMP